ncbi:MAG: hypothetical protein J7J25_00075 [Candidatus Omnitrophica bacterium]|nr:hypothetical protein [Candidatus Omnitrophota bacterium]
MFENILRIWKKEDFLKTILDDFSNMLDEAKMIFEKADMVLWAKKPAEMFHAEIYARDRKINEEEQRIRRKLVEHLSINPRKDFAACLVFMSVIKDAERIGDYGKNIFELNYIIKSELDDDFAKTLKDIGIEVNRNLALIKGAFAEADSKKAVSIMKAHGRVSSECESLIRSMASKQLSVDKAVGYTLLGRYYKRISAHSANIASSIVNPLEKIDFVAEGIL